MLATMDQSTQKRKMGKMQKLHDIPAHLPIHCSVSHPLCVRERDSTFDCKGNVRSFGCAVRLWCRV